MKLINVESLYNKEAMENALIDKIKGLPEYLVDGRYRNQKPDTKYAELWLIAKIEEVLNVKIDPTQFNLSFDEETNQIKISFTEAVLAPANRIDDLRRLIEDSFGLRNSKYEKLFTGGEIK